jgi:hypothetical protein
MIIDPMDQAAIADARHDLAAPAKTRPDGYGSKGKKVEGDNIEADVRTVRVEHAQCVLAALFGRSDTVANPKTAGGVNKYRNFITMESNNPAAMISTVHATREADEFLSMPTTVAAHLVPKIRIFAVNQKNEKSEYMFGLSDQHANDVLSQTGARSIADKKGNDVGILEVQIEDMTSQPAEEGVSLVVNIKMYFKNLGVFLTKKATRSGHVFADLVKRQVSAKDSYDPLNNQVILHAGYQLPAASVSHSDLGVTQGKFELIKKSILKSTHIYRLHLREHTFNFAEDGSVELDITYNAAVDAIANDPRTDLMMSPSEQDVIAEKRDMLSTLKKRIAKERKNSSANDLKEDQAAVKTLHGEIQKRTNNLRDESMSRFLDELFGLKEGTPSYIKRITVPAALLGAIGEEENLRSQGLKKLRTNQCGTYNTLLKAVDAASAPQSSAATRGKVAAAQNLKEAIADYKDKDGKLDSDGDVADRKKGIDSAKEGFNIKLGSGTQDPQRKKAATAIVKSALKGNSPFAADQFMDIAFFHYGDIVEVALNIMRRPGSPFETEYIAKGRIDDFPTPILGPMLMRDGQCGGETLRRKSTNIADVPVSVDFFIDFMTNKFIKPARSNLVFKEFIDVLNKTVLPGCLGETCRMESSGQHVVYGHTTPITIKKSGADDRCLGFPTSDGPAGFNHVTETYAKKRISRISSLSAPSGAAKLKEYMLIYVPNYIFTDMHGKKEQDLGKGIYHLSAGASQSIIKNFSIDANTQAFMAEAQSFPEDGKPQLGRDIAGSARYDLNLEMLGCTFLRIGSPFYFDIASLGIGSGHDKKTLAHRLGIGGYYQCNKINYSLTPSEFFVSVNAVFMGSVPELQALGRTTPEVAPPEQPSVFGTVVNAVISIFD